VGLSAVLPCRWFAAAAATAAATAAYSLVANAVECIASRSAEHVHKQLQWCRAGTDHPNSPIRGHVAERAPSGSE